MKAQIYDKKYNQRKTELLIKSNDFVSFHGKKIESNLPESFVISSKSEIDFTNVDKIEFYDENNNCVQMKNFIEVYKEIGWINTYLVQCSKSIIQKEQFKLKFKKVEV